MFGKDGQLIFILVLLVALAGIAGFYYINTSGMDISKISRSQVQTEPKYPNRLIIKSNAFENMGHIPEKYTCKGEDISPPLEFTNIPLEAKSLLLIVSDSDTPIKEFDHWVVYNINPKSGTTAENTIPGEGVQGQNSLGKGDYTGPCPPVGIHKYEFKIYALNTVVDNSRTYTRDQILEIYKENIIDKAVLVGIFEK